MSNTVVALEAAIALTTLAMRMSENSVTLQNLFLTAKSEDRDLNDDEIAMIKKMRHDAIERLESLR